MKKLIAVSLALPMFLLLARAEERHNHGGSTVTMNDDSSSDDCRDHLRVGNDEYRANVRDEEVKTIPNQPLTITAEHNGGIQVTTWDKPEVSLKLCKQIATDDESEGRKLLAETRLEINGSKISVHAPEENHHSLGTLLMIKAPRNAELNLNVRNGGVSLTNFTGTAEAHAENGGISFRRSNGKLTAEAENGGISIKDCGGDVSAKVENGGLSIALPDRWEGKGLEAHARNGGLVVSVPKTFSGGLEVVASEHTSIICKGDACDAGERTWDSGHKLFRMGGANPQVRATTENGGIVIQDRSQTRGE
ncbi:MAG TPA: hypothetical protein VH024_01840 [Candidatus Angelobacter sp.]|jgi:DUF4097 and DUF4098 domain-containing protein YvlB|nr:hypothetical protein [Candidatus Angelobacter sp.]